MNAMQGIVAAETCLALGATQERLQPYANRETKIGALEVSRALPVKDRRMVGPWCFLDRFGPLTFTEGRPMDVAPHPHIGLQTVTWLLEGEVLHDDSVGHESVLRPGGLNVMTSGSGIAHAERTPIDHTGRLNGVQLWTALPEEHRHAQASFQHVAEVPTLEFPGGVVHVFSGDLETTISPAHHYSELLGADVEVHPGGVVSIPLRPRSEYAVLVLTGECSLGGYRLNDRVLYYLGTQRSEVTMGSTHGGRVLLVGGPPFPETILMWWNFVARTPEEIRDARMDWEERRRFGEVTAYNGPRLSAPALVRFARPNPLS
jgi:redox-sensitive bicupin YhaK (pirin superfamily)